jgi:hypothetical protein
MSRPSVFAFAVLNFRIRAIAEAGFPKRLLTGGSVNSGEGNSQGEAQPLRRILRKNFSNLCHLGEAIWGYRWHTRFYGVISSAARLTLEVVLDKTCEDLAPASGTGSPPGRSEVPRLVPKANEYDHKPSRSVNLEDSGLSRGARLVLRCPRTRRRRGSGGRTAFPDVTTRHGGERDYNQRQARRTGAKRYDTVR